MVDSEPMRLAWILVCTGVGVGAAVGFGLMLSQGGARTNPKSAANEGLVRDPAKTPTTTQRRREAPHYVGSGRCASCHEEAFGAWKDSHHDRAMDIASPATVLGDFNNARFSYNGIESVFSRRGDDFFVKTDGPEGELKEYKIAFTFGVTPLQQYLIELRGGHIQALSIAWDARTREQGGQRWFHLYAGEKVDHQDPLHWTGFNQNWNYMCSECHSTGVKKNFDAKTVTYKTTWEVIDVGCEACHGPASRHVLWADKSVQLTGAEEEAFGLVVRFRQTESSQWRIEPKQKNAVPTFSTRSTKQVDACVRCHSRRQAIFENAEPGDSLLNTHMPTLLDDPAYHADGQINEEVFVYGSFLQSKMHRKGVRCADCHDPHSLKLRAEGNALCVRCHAAPIYDAASHHHHPPGAGSECVNCHMPAATYMVVDPRRDHSFRVPRPDLSAVTGAPNACNRCHIGRNTDWAKDQFLRLWNKSRRPEHYGEILAAARARRPEALPKIGTLVSDLEQPEIVRASAIKLLRNYNTPSVLPILEKAASSQAPLVRLAAMTTLETVPPKLRWSIGHKALKDPLRAIRIEAVRTLAASPEAQIDKPGWEQAIRDFFSTQAFLADRVDGPMNEGVFYLDQAKFDEAEAAFRRATAVDAHHIPAYFNLAEAHRLQNDESAAEEALVTALGRDPKNASVHHALGLLFIRTKQYEKALEPLKLAATQAPENPRFGFVYGTALRDMQQPKAARGVFETTLENHPHDREVLMGLIDVVARLGSYAALSRYEKRFAKKWPNSPAVHVLREALGRHAGSPSSRRR